MNRIADEARKVIEHAEWVAIATTGPDGPHLAATWGDYVRTLGVGDDQVLIPAGGLRTTEANIASDARVELLFASRQVQRASGAGQGCLLRGRAELQRSGPLVDRVKSHFPWARGVLVVHVEEASTQL
ncbi:MAG: pyridoxamine 5'-phosphate oxidase family protein [Bacteroidales bacterium]